MNCVGRGRENTVYSLKFLSVRKKSNIVSRLLLLYFLGARLHVGIQVAGFRRSVSGLAIRQCVYPREGGG